MNKLNPSQKKNLRIHLVLILGALMSYILPLIKIWHTTLIQDWGYFNALSHVVHSCIIYYKTIPIHDPWILGGLDIFANPQSRIFSPFVIFDVLFTAPMANLFALIVLGIIGVIGFYKLLRYLNLNETVSIIGAILFINTSWFSLHYAEGHIIFGSFQLLGLAFYYILRIQEAKFKLFYALLNAFYLLDGAMYAFIFTNILFVITLLLQTHQISLKGFYSSIIQQWRAVLLSVFLFISFASAKLVPLLLLHGSRKPILEFTYLNLKMLLHIFFDPIQHLAKRPEAMEVKGLGFHEFGTYFGIFGALIILAYIIRAKHLKLVYKYLIIAFIFLWIGSGRFPSINPWLLFQKIPIINNAHVQSRLFIITYLMLSIILGYALEYLHKTVNRKVFLALAGVLILESLAVVYFSYDKVYKTDFRVYTTSVFREPIKSTTINYTKGKASEIWGRKFLHYLDENTGALFANEPALVRGNIKWIGDADYKGELYITEGSGNVELLGYTPGKISLQYKLDSISEIQLNTNYLMGWKSKSKLDIYAKDWLLTIRPTNLSDKVVLSYRPNYLKIIIPLYFMGLITLVVFFIALWKQKKLALTIMKSL